jgi:hypothetical protein
MLMEKLLHFFTHWFGWNKGHVETWYEGDRLLVGFQCESCGKIEGISEITRMVEHEIQRASR